MPPTNKLPRGLRWTTLVTTALVTGGLIGWYGFLT
jgi:hypothetical protein